MAWKRSDWNAIIQQVNALDSECGSGFTPLDEVPEDHLWSTTDVTTVRDRLTEMCISAPEFSTELVKWKQDIIDELQAAIEDCDCTVCPVGYENPITERDYTLVQFPSYSDLWENQTSPLNYKAESLAASLDAASERDTLYSLMEAGASIGEVNAQVEILNSAAAIAHGYISAANTLRYSQEPAYPWINQGFINNSAPRLSTYWYEEEQYQEWRYCYTTVRFHVLNHSCYGDPPDPYGYDQTIIFEASPDGHLFCTDSDDGVFMYSNKFGCALNYSGGWDCTATAECMAAIAGEGLQQVVNILYETGEIHF